MRKISDKYYREKLCDYEKYGRVGETTDIMELSRYNLHAAKLRQKYKHISKIF